jgi:hypothetical protein
VCTEVLEGGLRTVEIDVACSITGWTETLHWS